MLQLVRKAQARWLIRFKLRSYAFVLAYVPLLTVHMQLQLCDTAQSCCQMPCTREL
jgi:hypothetical protein